MGPIATEIQKGYDIIKNIDRWAVGYYQYDKEGKKCPSAEGYSFCALGAIKYSKDSNDAWCALQRVSEELFGKAVQVVNDDTTVPHEVAHKNVLRIYETALERWKDQDPEPWELVAVELFRSQLKEQVK